MVIGSLQGVLHQAGKGGASDSRGKKSVRGVGLRKGVT